MLEPDALVSLRDSRFWWQIGRRNPAFIRLNEIADEFRCRGACPHAQT